MILGIDASNIRSGGGLTHLVEFLKVAEPAKHGFERVTVWSGTSTVSRVEDRPWLVKVRIPVLDGSLASRAYWQRSVLSRLAKKARCELLFVPGASCPSPFRRFVAMSQNMLPFEWVEASRYGPSWMLMRFLLLRRLQARTFRRAGGLVFLTRYARARVEEVVGRLAADSAIIPHGIDKRFFCPPRPQRDIRECTPDKPFHLLYVSIVDLYKHQWHVVEAVARLRARQIPVSLDLIGPAYPPALRRLKRAIARHRAAQEFVHYHGPVPYEDLPGRYRQADAFVFASSCENLPNILLEAMASGLPIVSSNRGPMPEVAGDAAVYCDPEDATEMAEAIETLIMSPSLRTEKARLAYERATGHSWERCAAETFAFLRRVVEQGRV